MTATAATFSVDGFWPQLEREKSHVIHTQRKNFSKALRDLRNSVDKVYKLADSRNTCV